MSGARATDIEPGWMRFNGAMRYQVKDLFVNGALGASQYFLRDGTRTQEYSLNHQQQFSQRTSLTANLNYSTNTSVRRNTQFNPFTVMQTIRSDLKFQTGRGPFSVNVGGTQVQYPGREQIDRTFPTLSISSRPIEIGEWFGWTPSLSISSQQRLHIDQITDFSHRYIQKPGGGLDSVRLDRNSRSSTITFDTPLEIRGFRWQNSFTVTDNLNDYPEQRLIVDVNDTTQRSMRVFRRTYKTDVNWTTGFSLPSFFQGTWNLAPSVQIQKIDGRSGLLVRTERTGNRFVSQGLRPAFSLGVSPTLYHIYRGVGPLTAIRHAISPTLSYQYTPRADISDEFLAANGDTRVGYLGANQQNIVSLGLNTNFEAKLRPQNDSLPPEQAQKITLLSLGFTSLAYDFERAKQTEGTGLTNTSFGINAKSDLIPGFDFGMDWSLFQGDPISDTATFSPFRTSVRATLSLGAGSPLVRAAARLVGLDVGEGPAPLGPGEPPPAGGMGVGAAPSFVAGQPITGGFNRMSLSAPRGQGWQLNLTYSSQRQRPPRGTGAVFADPDTQCGRFRGLPSYQLCVDQYAANNPETGPGAQTTRGGTFFVSPPQANAQSQLSFHVTERWGASWNTTYDFQLRQFASHTMTLTREMHDWDAVFSFLKAPNGNFAFNFHIALRAQPDLKFDFDRRNYPRGYADFRQ
jgi:hypothetical protein